MWREFVFVETPSRRVVLLENDIVRYRTRYFLRSCDLDCHSRERYFSRSVFSILLTMPFIADCNRHETSSLSAALDVYGVLRDSTCPVYAVYAIAPKCVDVLLSR